MFLTVQYVPERWAWGHSKAEGTDGNGLQKRLAFPCARRVLTGSRLSVLVLKLSHAEVEFSNIKISIFEELKR